MSNLKFEPTQKPNLPPKPKSNLLTTPKTPPTKYKDTTFTTQVTHTTTTTHSPCTHNTPSTSNTAFTTQNQRPYTPPTQTPPPKHKEPWPSSNQTGRQHMRKQRNVGAGRSEPDGSEMDDGLPMEQSSEPSSYSEEEKHCHCVCHLHRPGMKLMWVPDDQEDSHNKNTHRCALQKHDKQMTLLCRTSNDPGHTVTLHMSTHSANSHMDSTHMASTQQTFMSQEPAQFLTGSHCSSCWSFRVYHTRVENNPNENLYESMEVFCSSPEEPIYLQLQPSDDIIVASTPPRPPPRPLETLRTHQRERRKTQPVLAYMLSPRGGRPPIRTHSSCGTVSGRKAINEKKKSVRNKSETEDDTHKEFQFMRSNSRKLCVSEYVIQGQATLWQHLHIVRESEVLNTLTRTEIQKQECLFEVVTTEATYYRSLNVLRDHFLGSRELDDTLVVHDKKSLFSNISQVHEVSQRFLQDLLTRVDENVLISDVCDIIHHHAQSYFSVYIEYVRNQVYQEQTYSRLMQCNRVFHTVMRRLEESPLCNRLPFTSFMLLPFQRITRINILIQSILKNTPEGSREESTACRALTTVNELIKQANTQVGQMKKMEELIQVANMLEFDKLKAIPLVSKQRWLEKQGELQEFSKGGSLFSFRIRYNPVYVFLFNDLIILTRKSNVNPDRFLVLDHAHRSLVQVQAMESGTHLGLSFCLIMLENHQGNKCERVMKANTESDLHRWMAALPSMSDSSEMREETIYEDWDCPQVQCNRQYIAKQSDELNLEIDDIVNVLRKTSEGWWEGMRLSDRVTGWFPCDVVTEVTNEHQRRRNLREQYRISQAANYVTLE